MDIFEVISPDNNPPKGDDHISPYDAKLWMLTYHILVKFGEPVWFLSLRGNSPLKIDHQLSWFVPSGPNYNIISRFIYQEFKDDIRKGTELHDCYISGMSLRIMPFSGTQFYLEKQYIPEISSKVLERLNDHIASKNKPGFGFLLKKFLKKYLS